MTREEIYSRFEELDKRASLGGGVDKIEKQHAQGKMTARERIGMLLDKGTFNELDKLVNHRCTNFGMEKKQIAGDGMVTGYGKIDGRPVFVYAYDFTAHGGSLSETNAAKIVKVQQLALKTGAPVIALNDSGGARIQEGVNSLAGYASIFYQNTIASGVIPQISAILGPCAGGACYSPALTDFIFMVKEQSHMFITGPDVVKTVTNEEVGKEELGGAQTHSGKSGVTHFMCDNEEETLMSIRELLSFLPSNNMEDAPLVPCNDDIHRQVEALQTVIPEDPNMPYDIKDIIEPVLDNQYFFEVMPSFAKNVVIGFARMGGRSVGETFQINGYSANGWIAALWVMTIGGSVCILWSAFAIKPISMLYEKAEKINIKLVLAVGSGCLVGVMAYVSVSYGFSAMSTKGVVFCISFAVGALLMLVSNKVEKAKWLTDYIMTISMLAAMAAACVIF